MKKFLILLLTLCVAAGGFLFYIYKTETYSSFDKFPKNTIINGVDCSGLSVKQASKVIQKKWNDNTFYFYEPIEIDKSTIEEKGNESTIKTNKEELEKTLKEENLDDSKHGKTIAKIKGLDLKYDIKASLNQMLRPSFMNVIKRKLHMNTTDLFVNMKVASDNKKFEKRIAGLSIISKDGKVIKTKNACIDFSTSDFNIAKEVFGNDIDQKRVREGVYKNISEGKFYLNFKETDFYNQPTILSSNETLVNQQKYLKGLDVPSVTYKMPKKTIHLGKNQIVQLYGINAKTVAGKMKEETLTVDKKAVKKLVSKLAYKYNTVGKTRKFKSTLRGVVKVTGGSYGYSIDITKETKKLAKALVNNQDVNRAPVYSHTGYKNAKDIGNSYVEVDIKNQKLFMYKKGKLVTSFSVVTGSEYAGHGTHSGVYYLMYKQRGAVLKGSNGDGTEYASPVAYWMPFNGGEGLHDANWRGSFGGNIYLTSGSHGCINCPPSKTAKLFNNIEAGYPVIVFR